MITNRLFILVMLTIVFVNKKAACYDYRDATTKTRPICFAASCILESDKEPCYMAWNVNKTKTCNGGAVCKMIQKRYLSNQIEIVASCDYICREEVCRTDLDSYTCTKQCCTEDYCNNTSNARLISPNVRIIAVLLIILFDVKSIFDSI